MEEAKEFLVDMYKDWVKEENENALAKQPKEEDPNKENEEGKT